MKPYKSRVLILSLVLALIFGAVFYRLQDMIVEKSDAYSARAATKSTKTISGVRQARHHLLQHEHGAPRY